MSTGFGALRDDGVNSIGFESARLIDSGCPAQDENSGSLEFVECQSVRQAKMKAGDLRFDPGQDFQMSRINSPADARAPGKALSEQSGLIRNSQD